MKTITIRVPDDTYKELMKVKHCRFKGDNELDQGSWLNFTWLEVIEFAIYYNELMLAYLVPTHQEIISGLKKEGQYNGLLYNQKKLEDDEDEQ